MPFLLLFFFGSGCAALIYEIVWFQMLSLIIGSSAVSLAVLLGTFMGGMCLGSLLLPRLVGPRHHPLRVYAVLEAGIALCGVGVYLVLPHAGGLYVSIAGPGFAGLLVRGALAGICLVPPTLLMGATLPAIARWVRVTPQGVSWLGFFYGGNIVGAVCGCLLAGFYLLRVHDVATATAVAVALNTIVTVGALIFARSRPYSADEDAPAAPAPVTAPAQAWPIYVAIGISGMAALGAEVVWTRLLSLLLGQTVYTFSLILAGFLGGLALGSTAGSAFARSARNPRAAFGGCQLLLVACIGWAAYALTTGLPQWQISVRAAETPAGQFGIDLVRCLLAVLPATILWGASFPLALAALARGQPDSGRLVGGVYAANTVGAIAGAMLASLVFIPQFGTQHSQRILVALAAGAAALMLGPVPEAGRLTWRPAGLRWAVIAVALGGWIAATVAPVPAVLVGYGLNAAAIRNQHQPFLYMGEGMNSSMAVSEFVDGTRYYHNAGKIQASSLPEDMRLQRMLGHLTTLVPADPNKVLVIACGAGVTAGAVSIDPMVTQEYIVEIEPLVPKVVARYFDGPNFGVVTNPKVRVEIDDARHFLLSTKETFDAITSDPFDPWVKGAAALYTKEFWELAKRHLNPGGVITVFVQLYESTESAVKSEVATFLEVFPHGVVFSNTFMGEGYDVVMVAQDGPLRIDLDAIEARLARPEYAPLRQSLREIGFHSAIDLFATFAGDRHQFTDWLKDAEINRDRNLRLQYLAGFGSRLYLESEIHRNMIRARHYPEGIFSGSPERIGKLREAIENGEL